MRILLIFLLISAPACYAEVTTDLPELLVSASRMEGMAGSLPAAHRVITATEIRESGAQSLSAVLEMLAGIQMRDLYGEGSRPTIALRGFGGNAGSNALILLNGRKLNNQADVGAVQLTTVPLSEIQRIEIVYGSAGVLYGDSAVGGMLNIVTRPLTDRRLTLSASAGSHDRGAGSARGEYAFTDALRGRLHFSQLETDNYRRRNRREESQIGAGLELETGAYRLFADWDRFDESLQLPGALFIEQTAQDRKQPDSNFSFTDTQSDALRSGWHADLSRSLRGEIDYNWRDDDLSGVLVSGGAPCRLNHQNREQWELAPRFSWRPQGGGTYIIGWDREHADFELSSCLGEQFADQDVDALYVQAQYPLLRNLDLLLGARRVWVDTDVRDSFNFPAGTNASDRRLIKDVGLEFRPTGKLRIYARRSENFRFAKVEEHTAQPVFPAPALLNTQTGYSLETGLAWTRNAHHFSLDLYQLNLENEIAFDPSAAPFAGNRNLDPTRRNGALFSLARQGQAKLGYRLDLAYVDAEFREGPNRGKDISFVARRRATLNLDYRFRPGLLVGLNQQYTSRRKADGDDPGVEMPVPGFSRTNVFAHWKHRKVQVSLRLENLWNKRYNTYGAVGFRPTTFTPDTSYYPAPERNFTLRISLEM